MTTTDTAALAAKPSCKPQKTGTCPECGEKFKGPFDKLFCSTTHKQAWHNRAAKRGVVMMPLVLAWRGGRGSTEEAGWAWGEIAQLADAFNAEDVKAGRMSAGKYARRRRAAGWSAVDYAFG